MHISWIWIKKIKKKKWYPTYFKMKKLYYIGYISKWVYMQNNSYCAYIQYNSKYNSKLIIHVFQKEHVSNIIQNKPISNI